VPKTHNTHLTKSYYFTRHLERGCGEVMMPVGPLTHDGPHLFSLCSWILFGGKLVLYPSTKPKDLLEQIDKERVTYFFAVPTLVTDMVNEPGLDKYDLSSLSAIMLGGARINAEFVKTTVDRLKVSLHPGYGSTEGPGAFPRRYDPLEVVTNTYGRGLCPYDTYKIIDEKGNEVPTGQEGEIIFRGPCMFTGYYKSEDEDKLVFTPNGFHYTGDIGKFDQYGNIMITGRKKDIIRRGAESISAPEIEAMIIAHPKVLRAAVVGMPDPRLGERICAYVQLLPGEELTLKEIISYLRLKGFLRFSFLNE
jgi:non-ribosomal peptide synthetase component E (peptide arylation enzyme)